jgi:hypothetical protein
LVWAEVLGVNGESRGRLGPYVEDEVAALLRDLRDEVTTIEHSLAGTEITPLFVPLASLTRALTGPALLVMDWNQLKTTYGIELWDKALPALTHANNLIP